jgi:UDPglucose 6-dehydrogenase
MRMIMNTKIGVVGRGVVGDAVANAYETANFKVLVYDIKEDKSNTDIAGIAKCDTIFICAPTPARRDFRADLEPLDKIIGDLAKEGTTSPIVVVSTVPPNTFKRYPDTLCLISMPEFLVASRARQDYIDPKRVVIGGENQQAVNDIIDAHKKMLFRHGSRSSEWFVFSDPNVPQAIKYANNLMLAMKVLSKDLVVTYCDAVGVVYEDVRKVLLTENRIGTPEGYGMDRIGPEGRRGIGLACFPKDLRSVIATVMGSGDTDELNLAADALYKLLEYNATIREEELRRPH